ncbi:MAG TPA: T9SS type A sorting domain-containing protein [bacterium (Candidatus Stahlbacteria)]|nr:T9SS type A sorting domain-containing protein [Candidatus Stahlbacteria bacterium]
MFSTSPLTPKPLRLTFNYVFYEEIQNDKGGIMRYLVFGLLFFTLAFAGQYDLVKINAQPGEARFLDRMGVVINEVGSRHIIAEVPKDLMDRMRTFYDLTIIQKDIDDVYVKNSQTKGPFSVYLSYTQYRDSMIRIAQLYPNICRLETLGLSHQNRLLLIMKVSDNPDVDETEPPLHLEYNIHGNEKITWGVGFCMLNYIVNNYPGNSTVKDLVENREIWLAPMVNPDGYNNSNRHNARGVDLNRNWGWMWGNEYACGSDFFSENESWKFMEHYWRHPFVLYASYHSGTLYISEAWSYTRYLQPPEQNLIRHLSQGYSSFTGYPYGQGSVGMYPINGCTKDYDYGCGGEIGWSIEVCHTKTPPAESIDAIFNGRERAAMLYLMHKAGKGIHGSVTDSVTGSPLQAMIYIDDKWQSYSCPVNGDFHRFYLPGTYDLTFMAPGYDPKTVNNVQVPSSDTTVTVPEVKLHPNPSLPIYATRMIGSRYVTTSSNLTYPTKALGPHDNDAYRLDATKWIVLACDWPLRDTTGNDVTVYRSQGSGSATVKVSNNWRGPWTTLGTANSAQTSFDLNSVGVDSARYVRLEASSTFYLDAVEGVQVPKVAEETPRIAQTGKFSIWPTMLKSGGLLNVVNPLGRPAQLKIYNTLGQVSQRSTVKAGNSRLKIRNLPAGVYFVNLEGVSGSPSRIVLIR